MKPNKQLGFTNPWSSPFPIVSVVFCSTIVQLFTTRNTIKTAAYVAVDINVSTFDTRTPRAVISANKTIQTETVIRLLAFDWCRVIMIMGTTRKMPPVIATRNRVNRSTNTDTSRGALPSLYSLALDNTASRPSAKDRLCPLRREKSSSGSGTCR